MLDHRLDIFVILSILIVLGSRYFYFFSLRLYGWLWLKRHDYAVTDFQFSFEEVHYTVALSGKDPTVALARSADLLTKPTYLFVVFPRLVGLQMLLRDASNHRILVAYLPVGVFNSPLLDQLLATHCITEDVQERLRCFFLLHPLNIRAIRTEVYNRMVPR